MEDAFQEAINKFYSYDEKTQKFIIYKMYILYALFQHFKKHQHIINSKYYLMYVMLYVNVFHMCVILYKKMYVTNNAVENKLLRLQLFVKEYRTKHGRK